MKSQKFDGIVTNTSLHDIIQLLCIGRATCRMRVRSGNQRGSLYFKDGEVVHAETDTLTGEEAFYDILSLEVGVFDCDTVQERIETIRESWDFLLMESMRRIDAPLGR